MVGCQVASELLAHPPSAKRLSGQGQALVLANNGVVSDEARTALERAVALDQSLTEPRILIAIAKEQDGQFAAAIEDWRAILTNSQGDAPWRKMVSISRSSRAIPWPSPRSTAAPAWCGTR